MPCIDGQWQYGVHPAGWVHELCDAQVDRDAGQRQHFLASDRQLALHQVEHGIECGDRGLVEASGVCAIGPSSDRSVSANRAVAYRARRGAARASSRSRSYSF